MGRVSLHGSTRKEGLEPAVTSELTGRPDVTLPHTSLTLGPKVVPEQGALQMKPTGWGKKST